jgi:hypothetical protein
MGCLVCCLQVLHCLDHRSIRCCKLTVACRSQTARLMAVLTGDATLNRGDADSSKQSGSCVITEGGRFKVGVRETTGQEIILCKTTAGSCSILCSCSLCCVGRTQFQSTSARVVECAYGMASTLSAASSCTIRPGQMTNNVQLLSEL